MGDGGRGAIALEADLNVAGQVVLHGSCAGCTAHAKGGEGGVVGMLVCHQLNLAEGTVGGHYSATHILQNASTSCIDTGAEGVAVGAEALTDKIGCSPAGSGEGATVDASIVGCGLSASINLISQVSKRNIVAAIGCHLTVEAHLYIQDLEKIFPKFKWITGTFSAVLDSNLPDRMPTPPAEFTLPLTSDGPAGQNGRVTFDWLSPILNKAPDTLPGLPGFETVTKVQAGFQADMLRGNWEATPVSDAFFSLPNVERIQQLIRKGVYDKSQPKGYIIDDQSSDELKIIMRAIYYQYGKNMPKDTLVQVEDLNQKVINWCIPHILSAVDHYFYYIQDISHLPVPLQQPQSLSSAGTRSKPLKPFM